MRLKKLDVKFDFDRMKNSRNKAKHGITFEHACTIFLGEILEIFFDGDHSSLDEDRYVAIGRGLGGEIFVVVHTESEDGGTIRPISARRATKNEIKRVTKGKK